MKKKKEKQEDSTAEAEDQPAWQAGIEEGKLIMKACIKAASEVCMDHYEEAGITATGKPDEYLIGGIAVRKLTDIRQEIGEMAIAMYQSVVMMEMERGRLAGAKMQMLAGNLEGRAASIEQLLKPC